mmetsp:Transcript_5252/g.6623  ORF Transcript_5252/g.6623 Transcript_5252/m.6623 type:complete len:89 (+) Transcript_5252:39-305(+)
MLHRLMEGEEEGRPRRRCSSSSLDEVASVVVVGGGGPPSLFLVVDAKEEVVMVAEFHLAPLTTDDQSAYNVFEILLCVNDEHEELDDK